MAAVQLWCAVHVECSRGVGHHWLHLIALNQWFGSFNAQSSQRNLTESVQGTSGIPMLHAGRAWLPLDFEEGKQFWHTEGAMFAHGAEHQVTARRVLWASLRTTLFAIRCAYSLPCALSAI
jgi:hypothetical protein